MNVDMRNSFIKIELPKQLLYLLISWLVAATLEYILLPVELRGLTMLDGLGEMSAIRMGCIGAIVYVGLNLASSYIEKRKTERYILVCTFGIYAAMALSSSFTWPFFAACIFIQGMLIIYMIYGWNDSPHQFRGYDINDTGWLVITAIAALLFFCLVSGWTVARVRSFCTPTFDFGIFSQMFYNMKETGLPMTTVERDGLLSHFAVHVSPIYYLMLPFYMVVPRPETLQVLQALVLASAVIPLWKLGRLYGLHPRIRTGICVLLLLYPAFAGGTSYDIHENCFLTPLILWLLYGIDKKNLPMTGIFAVLVCMVKEDAPVYVAVIGLYVLLRSLLHKDKWGICAGAGLMIGAVAWFLAATTYLASSGDGVMTYRYQNFMYDGSDSLFTVIKAVLLCPLKAVFECVDPEKLEFLGLTMLPVLGLPLWTRKYERFILLIPYVLVNLMSDYTYQHDIMFQYVFGSIACLFYLITVNIGDFPEKKYEFAASEDKIVREEQGIRKKSRGTANEISEKQRVWERKAALLILALCLSLGAFTNEILPVAARYMNYCKENGDYYDAQRKLLDQIPDSASVAATTFYTTYLSGRTELYDIRYGSTEHILGCEYVVVRIGDQGSYSPYEKDGQDGEENFVKMLLNHGYSLEDEMTGVIQIYRKEGQNYDLNTNNLLST